MRITPLVATVIMTTTITIPMTMSWASICHAQIKNGVEVQQLWCNSDIYHFDLSYWAFEQLAHPTYGVMMVDFRYGSHDWLKGRVKGIKMHSCSAERHSEEHQKALVICWKAEWRVSKCTHKSWKAEWRAGRVHWRCCCQLIGEEAPFMCLMLLKFWNVCLILHLAVWRLMVGKLRHAGICT